MFEKPGYKTKGQRRREQNLEYSLRRRSFLIQKRWCELRVAGRCRDYPAVATDVHHTLGREGELLLDERYWKAGCRPCHDWVESNRAEAYKLGLLLKRNQVGN